MPPCNFLQDLFDKAELAAKKFIDTARSIVFVDNLTILHGLNDCQVCKSAQAGKYLSVAFEGQSSGRGGTSHFRHLSPP